MFARRKPTESDRGRQIAHRAQNPTSRHMTDVRGAIGCYFCWLGEYDKCEKNCTLVHALNNRAPDEAAEEAAENTNPRQWNHFARAAPHLTAAAAQVRSIFDESHMPGAKLRRRSESPARARQTLRSLHEPRQFIPKYKHPRESVLIDVTPYTKLSVA
eukprot:CAMPEP_0174837046 /NCGR_PEP_ID=MMETSP1114-20130205/6483_1 /TAXON_ID=312471 /ORGANISM="Neobodo designis, Strain CCAP 1951/1" /LENGTH=157 /DNA_ID=CAMNT_0016071081 /DNA_START=25 /DNA_END=494 /DNA_ORIENTATION=-